MISSRPEVATVADYGTLNFRGEQEYTLHGKNVSICGGNESIVTEIFNVLDEGTFPKTENEAMISINAKDTLKLKIGEQIVITTPNGTEFSYIISGFMKNSANLMREDVYGVFLTTDGFRTIYSNETDVNPSEYTMFFVLFDNKGNIPKEIAEIKEQYGLSDKQVTENITLLGLMGQSDDSFMAQVYTVAIILFFLVLMAGVLMIASSMNTNVAQRTEFFGMVRCIGATPKQVMQLVRKEVMNWCRFAIPLGVIGGMVLVWVLCFILRQLSPQYFGEDTFRKLTGETDYSIIDIQLSQNATENDVNEIHRLVGSQYTFSDERMGNSNTRGAYYCFGLFIYGFLVLIALITLFNIINSIAMSVVAKMKQYGVFRAIGLSNRQLAKMIIAEASTYAITGTICGSVLGIVCNKILFSKLITYKWGDAWSVPLVQLGIIIVVVAIAVILAVRNPIKKLEKTSIVDIISVQ